MTMMRSHVAGALSIVLLGAAAAPGADLAQDYQAAAARIIREATGTQRAFDRLSYLSDYFPHRLSGSQMLEDAIDWAVTELRRDGIPVVRTQDVLVPHWVRGREHAALVHPYARNIPILGLGHSVGTPAAGITAATVVVESFAELEARSREIPGKIVVYNQPFTTYGETVQYRAHGADRAAEHGAVAVLVRAVSPHSMGHPHTGAMGYSHAVEPIPTASIAAEDAALLRRFDQRGDPPIITLYMEARMMEEPALSRNVIAEIPGSEWPQEVVVIGGHLDSWDVGHGAMDNASGVIVTWEALRLIHELDLRPRRTLRLVLWTNEENGAKGALAYRDKVMERGELERHQLALEVDYGVFRPLGFGFNGTPDALRMLQPIAALMAPLGALHVRAGASGTVDIVPLHQQGVPIMGLDVDTEKYFWYHHSAKDTVDKLDARQVAECVAAVAVMAYVVADMPDRLPW